MKAGFVDRARLRPGRGGSAVAQVHDQDLVAESVHLDEGVVGEGAHVRAYMANRASEARQAPRCGRALFGTGKAAPGGRACLRDGRSLSTPCGGQTFRALAVLGTALALSD